MEQCTRMLDRPIEFECGLRQMSPMLGRQAVPVIAWSYMSGLGRVNVRTWADRMYIPERSLQQLIARRGARCWGCVDTCAGMLERQEVQEAAGVTSD